MYAHEVRVWYQNFFVYLWYSTMYLRRVVTSLLNTISSFPRVSDISLYIHVPVIVSHSSVVCEWVFGLVDRQRNTRDGATEANSKTCSTLRSSDSQQCYVDNKCTEMGTQNMQKEARNVSTCESSEQTIQPEGTGTCTHSKKTDKYTEKRTVKGKHKKESETSPPEDSSSSDGEDIALLKEMFPDLTEECLRNTLKRCGRDMDSTIQRLLTMADQERERGRKKEKKNSKEVVYSYIV